MKAPKAYCSSRSDAGIKTVVVVRPSPTYCYYLQRGVYCYQFWSVRAVPDVADKSAYVVPVAAVMPGNTDAGHAVSSDGEIVLGVFAALETLIQTSRPPL